MLYEEAFVTNEEGFISAKNGVVAQFNQDHSRPVNSDFYEKVGFYFLTMHLASERRSF